MPKTLQDKLAELEPTRLALIRAEADRLGNQAHSHCSNHRTEIEASPVCGCFFCCAVFPSSEILDWVDNEQTALCPRCGIDSVIGTASGFPVTDKGFLAGMRERWF